MKLPRILAIAGAALLTVLTPRASARAQTLWYNGDLVGQSATLNQVNSSGAGSRIFDDFVVPAGQEWHVTAIWSNDFLDAFFGGQPPRIRLADWSIRQGMSPGNGGTIIASGMSTPAQAYRSNPNFLYEEDTITVSGLSITLPAGTYWLQVTPVVGDAYNSITHGSGAIGLPAGNDGNSFIDRPSGGSNYAPLTADFSMGIAGTAQAVPEPGVLALLAGGLAGPLVALRRRRRS